MPMGGEVEVSNSLLQLFLRSSSHGRAIHTKHCGTTRMHQILSSVISAFAVRRRGDVGDGTCVGTGKSAGEVLGYQVEIHYVHIVV